MVLSLDALAGKPAPLSLHPKRRLCICRLRLSTRLLAPGRRGRRGGVDEPAERATWLLGQQRGRRIELDDLARVEGRLVADAHVAGFRMISWLVQALRSVLTRLILIQRLLPHCHPYLAVAVVCVAVQSLAQSSES